MTNYRSVKRCNARIRQLEKMLAGKPKKTYNKEETSKLKDKAINTLTERVAVRVANRQIAKQRRSLVLRNFLWGSYDPVANEWEELNNVPTQYNLISWNGISSDLLFYIQKEDVEMQAAQLQANHPHTEMNEAAPPSGPDIGAPAPGLARGTTDTIKSGYRTSSVIFVTSLSAKLKININNHKIIHADGTSVGPPGVTRGYLEWAFVVVTLPQPIPDVNYAPPLSNPTADKLLPISSWGYNSLLDTQESSRKNELKRRVVARGKLRFSYDDVQEKQHYKTCSVNLKNPIMIKFDPKTQLGNATNKKIYFVCRSTIPEDPAFNDKKPSVFAVTKLFYYEQ